MIPNDPPFFKGRMRSCPALASKPNPTDGLRWGKRAHTSIEHARVCRQQLLAEASGSILAHGKVCMRLIDFHWTKSSRDCLTRS